jgi:ribosome-binding factor A
LKSASGYLRHELGKRMSLRATPALTFIFDDSIAKGTHLLSLINSLDIKEADDDESSDD